MWGWDSLLLRYPSEFLSTTHGCGTSPFRISAPPTSLNRCGFFNSVVVRLPFSLISESSEWWWFYALVVILMWLYKEVSRVYPCHHLDRKSLSYVTYYIKYYQSDPCGSVGWALSCKAKGRWFDSQSGHMPGLLPSPPQGTLWEATDRFFTHTSIFFSLSFSLPSPHSKYK